MDELEKSSDIICLLTKNSRRKPWVLYEAGVARGRKNMQIIGLCIGIRISPNSPIAIYQACECDKEGLLALMTQLIQRNTELDVEHKKTKSNMESSVEQFIANLEKEQDGNGQ